MSAAKAVTTADFDEEVLKSDIPVLVDFWAEWCGPCRALGPVIDEIAKNYEGRVKVLKLDVQSESAKASEYGVVSIPSLLIFKNGTVVERMVGLQPKQNIASKLDNLI